jgi:hypothetical protein
MPKIRAPWIAPASSRARSVGPESSSIHWKSPADQCEPRPSGRVRYCRRVGRNGVATLLRLIAKGEDERVPAVARDCLAVLAAQIELVTRQILDADRRILAWHRSSELSQRLEAIPGVGPLVASALIAAIPDPKVFRCQHNHDGKMGVDYYC